MQQRLHLLEASLRDEVLEILNLRRVVIDALRLVLNLRTRVLLLGRRVWRSCRELEELGSQGRLTRSRGSEGRREAEGARPRQSYRETKRGQESRTDHQNRVP